MLYIVIYQYNIYLKVNNKVKGGDLFSFWD